MPMRMADLGKPSAHPLESGTHLERHLSHRLRMVGPRFWEPAATMYASPMVLIFSTPNRSASASDALKMSFRTPTTRSARFGSVNGEVDDVGEGTVTASCESAIMIV